jgi:hypothetical protein
VEWVHTIIPGSLQKATESSDRPGFLSRARQHPHTLQPLT